MIHRKKKAPALQRRDILTVSFGSSFCLFFVFVLFFEGKLFRSFSTQLLVVLFF